MKMRLTKPITNGTFTYSYRDTGDAWSDPVAMVGGVNEPTRNFVSPVCDELKIAGALGSAEVLDRVHVCGLSIVSGLSFEVVAGSSLGTTAQTVYSRPKRVHRQTLRVAATSTDAPELIITGIGQAKLNLRQVVFGSESLTPEDNFVWASPLTIGNSYFSHRTNGANYQTLDDRSNAQVLNFQDNPDDDYLDFEHFIDETVVDGYCLYERNTTSTNYKDSFLVNASLGQISPQSYDINNFNILIKEVYPQ